MSEIAFQIVFGRDLDIVPIEPVVLVEARVLRGDCWSEVADLGLAKQLIAAMIVKRKNTGFEESARVALAPFSPRAHLRRGRRLPFTRRVRPYGSTNPDAIHSHEIGEFLQLAENVSHANGAVVRRPLGIPFAEKLSNTQ